MKFPDVDYKTPRLSRISLKARVGLAAAIIVGGAVSMFTGWGWVAVGAAVVAGAGASKYLIK